MRHFDYVTVGHVTVDALEDERRPGGGAFYSALQAARLGLRTLIVTRGVPRELNELLRPYAAELQIEIAPATGTTTLRTRGSGHDRKQWLLAWAGPIAEPTAIQTAILHFAPIARETPHSWEGRADFLGLTPQGLVRTWNARGELRPVQLDHRRLPVCCDGIVFSANERESCAELIPDAPSSAGAQPGARRGPMVAVTAGPRSTTILQAGCAPLHVPASPVAHPRDDLGAGDVFAAAFFAALHEGLAPAEAGAFGNAAAAVRIAGQGPNAIGDRRAIVRRLG